MYTRRSKVKERGDKERSGPGHSGSSRVKRHPSAPSSDVKLHFVQIDVLERSHISGLNYRRPHGSQIAPREGGREDRRVHRCDGLYMLHTDVRVEEFVYSDPHPRIRKERVVWRTVPTFGTHSFVVGRCWAGGGRDLGPRSLLRRDLRVSSLGPRPG